MARSLATLREQISRLQKEADAMQQAVVLRIRKEIAQYELTPEQLFGAAPKTARKTAAPGRAKGKAATPAKAPKFADEAGNTWGGMGKRPDWLREALAAGRSIDEFRIGDAARPAAASKPRKARKAVAKKKPAPGRRRAKAAAEAPAEA